VISRLPFHALLAIPLFACAAAHDPAAPAEAVGTSEVASAPIGTAPACVASAKLSLAPASCTNDDALDVALARVGADRCTLALSPSELSLSKLDASDARMLPAARAAQRSPLALPGYGVATASALDAAGASSTPVAQAIAAASALRDAPITVCPDAAWYAAARADAPLAQALAEARGAKVDLAEVRAVPLELQHALVPILRAVVAANAEIESAHHDLSPELLHVVSTVPTWMLGVRHFEWSASVPTAFESVDVTRITRAAANVALVVESANLARFAGTQIDSLDLATPLGPIVLRGPGPDTWSSADAEAPLLLLDTGGDDTYLAPIASGTVKRPVSIAIDLGGRDTYAYRESRVAADAIGARMPSDGSGRADDGRTLSRVARQGAGVLGVGLLFDLGDGADTYRSLIGSQGVGSHGVGVLYDAGGNDTYEAEGFSQGAAAWGIGLLLDASGDDRFTIYQAGQGYGFTHGVGALVDRAGDDVYVANPGEPSLGGDILYPSDQLRGKPTSAVAANHSFAQGCGAGHRPDWPDAGYPFPGGIGILRDASGRDRYVAGVFAQGIGFVQGLGMLLEGSGDDTYDALYYAQGVAVHQGLALFADRDGADQYDVTFPNQGASLGLANDLAVAVFLDANGDDRFNASGLSLGAGLANGLAIFANDGGNDVFRASSAAGFGTALTGDVTGMRATLPTVGVFVKARGRGTYLVGDAPVSRSGHAWGEDEDGKGPARSAGVDQPEGRVLL
jgi:hypothetical protein